MAQKKNDDVVTVTWEDCAGIEEAVSLREKLLDEFSKGKNIELDISAVTDIDITGIQIILAAGKEAEKQKKKFFLKENIPQEIIEFASGFGIALDQLNLAGGPHA